MQDRQQNRISLRLASYDYARTGLYFITICVHERQNLFGDISDGRMKLNEAGQMIEENWAALAHRFPNLVLDTFVVMPNHLHGIIHQNNTGSERDGEARAQSSPLQEGYTHPKGTGAATVGRAVQAFKSVTTFQYTQRVKNSGWMAFNGKIWQRNYHDHIIRDGEALEAIRNYIIDNPTRWAEDEENPASGGG